MAQTSLNSTGVASSGALSLQSNGTTEAIGISTGQVATLAQNPILTSGTANGVGYLNGSKVLTTGSALVFDGSNLGLGVTPSAWSGAGKIFEAGAAGSALIGWGASEVSLGVGSYYNSGWKWAATNSLGASQYNQYNGAHYWSVAAPTSHTAGNAISFTQAMTLDASGNLLLGTTTQSGSAKFTFQQSADTTVGGIAIVATDGNGANISRLTDGGLTFRNGGAERARIDSSGNLLVGRTTVPTFSDTTGFGLAYDRPNKTTFFVTDQATSIACTYHNATSYTSGTAYFTQFRVNGAAKGEITSNGTITSYTSLSDYRLKEDIAPMTGALAKVALLKPVTYTWKENGENSQGFIAHELQAVVPDCVTGEKDAVDSDGNPRYQGIDTSFLVATLTAAIQEQQALITSLTARITALEA